MSNVRDLFGSSPSSRSIALIREWEPEALKFSPDGYHVAFSGGKDSIVIHDLALRSGVKFTAHHAVTGMEPELFRFVRQHYPRVELIHPKRSFYQLIEKKGLPTRRFRFCCAEIKETAGNGKFIITGVRSEESPRRASRPAIEPCTKRHSMFLHPIKGWTSVEVWDYIRQRGLAYPSLYDEGFKRLGCVVCPFESNKARSMARWPHIWKAVERAAHRRYAIRENEGYREKYRSAEGYWQWWLSGMAAKPDENQCTLFEGGVGE